MNNESSFLSNIRSSTGSNIGVYNIFFSINVNNTYSYLIKNIRDFYVPKEKIEVQEKELILKAPKIDPDFQRVLNSSAFNGLISSLIKNKILDKSALIEEKTYVKTEEEEQLQRNYIQYPSVNNNYEMLEVKNYAKSIVKTMEIFFNSPGTNFFKKNKKYKVSNIKIFPEFELVDINTLNPDIDNKVILKDGSIVFSPYITTYIPLLAKITLNVKPENVPSSLELLKVPTSKEKVNEYIQNFSNFKKYHCERNKYDFNYSYSVIRNKALKIKEQIDVRESFDKQVVFRFDDIQKSPYNLNICLKKEGKTFKKINCFDELLEDINNITERNKKLHELFSKYIRSYKKNIYTTIKTKKTQKEILQYLESRVNNLNKLIRAYLLIWYKWNGIYNGNLLPNLIVYDKEFRIDIFPTYFELILKDSNYKQYSILLNKKTKEEKDNLLKELQSSINKGDNIINIKLYNLSLNEDLFNRNFFNVQIIKKIATLLNIPVFKSDLKNNLIQKILSQIRMLKNQGKLKIDFYNVLELDDDTKKESLKRSIRSQPSSTRKTKKTNILRGGKIINYKKKYNKTKKIKKNNIYYL